ncbi:MAG: 30S ribosomal protein S6 [Bacteroidota bacterium]
MPQDTTFSDMELRNYQTTFILTPVLTHDEVAEAVAVFKDFLAQHGAEVVYEKATGLQKLAYPIQHKSTGIYYLITFRAQPELISKLTTIYKRSEKLIRFMTTVSDRHAVAYNAQNQVEDPVPVATEDTTDEVDTEDTPDENETDKAVTTDEQEAVV